MNLFDGVEPRRLKFDGTNYQDTGATTDVVSQAIDMSGYDGVAILVCFGPITSGAVTSFKVRQGAASNMSDGADLAGSKQTIADTDDNRVFVSDIYRPQERYIDVSFDRGTQNAEVDSVVALLYGPHKKPITTSTANGYMVGGLEKFASPDEGTA